MNINTNDNIIKILILLLTLLVFVVFILVAIYLYMKLKLVYDEKGRSKDIKKEKKIEDKSRVSQEYSTHSIFNFMEFDKIEDNMIIQQHGKKFLMVIKCQGVNFDLMSEIEKVSVEKGFWQYLNTLRHQIQIYVQTTTVDLSKSLMIYRDKVGLIALNLQKKQLEYSQNLKNGIISQEELEKKQRDIIKMRNLYEYGIDIIKNTENISLNKNILSKHYYIIIPYYAEEVGIGDYSKDEIQNMAFSELYTRAQSTISLLSVCGVVGKILDSFEISNLLYKAYNRDEAEVYDLQKAINARYDELYTTAPDVMDKKIKALDNKIEQEALKMANNAIMEVKNENEKEKILRQKEEDFDKVVKELAKIILNKNRSNVGIKTIEKAKKKIDEDGKINEREVNEDEAIKKERKSGRPRKNSEQR